MSYAPGRTTGIHALLVGVETYEFKKDVALDGPARAVCEMAEWLCRDQGAKPEHLLIHVSPKPENKDAFLRRIAALKLSYKPGPATQNEIRNTVIENLSKRQGELLLLYWCGHGFVEDELERRLLYSDATEAEWRHAKLYDLLRYMRTEHFPGFRRLVGFVDACAQNTATMRPNKLNPYPFPDGKVQSGRSQFVLLSSSLGEFAQGADNQGAVPLFTSHLLVELKKSPKGEWPNPASVETNLRSLDANLRSRFASLRAGKRTRQTPSRYFVQDWNEESIDAFGSLVPPRRLISRGWLLQERLDDLLQALPDDFLPEALLANLYRHSLPAHVATRSDRSLRGILDHLVDLPLPRQDAVVPLFRFVRQLANRLPAVQGGLERWLEEMAQAHPNLQVMDEEVREARQRYFVTVVIGAEAVPLEATRDRPEREGRIALIRVWKEGDDLPLGDDWVPNEPLALVEFCLPRVLLSEPVEEWNFPDRFGKPRPLGAAYPVVLRDTQRPWGRDPRIEWEERWRRLSQVPRLSVERLPWLKGKNDLPPGNGTLSEIFYNCLPKLKPEDDDTRVCIGFSFNMADDFNLDKDNSLLFSAWQAGLPSAVWFRQPFDSPDKMMEFFNDRFRGTLLHELPRRLWELRREAHERRKNTDDKGEPTDPKMLISLVWDDPSRIPYDRSASGAAR
jgi:vWA-MoxR associated protein C-terminal domain/Caspase domain